MKRIFFLILVLTAVNVHSQDLKTGKDHFSYERFNSAETHFHALLQAEPTNAEAWYWLTKSYLALKNDKEARDSILLAPSGVHNDPWYLVAYGSLLLNEKKGDSATIYFEKALDETKRKDADILAAVADAHINSPNGEAPYAIELLQIAMKRDKKNGQLNVLLGNAYRKQYNGSEAYKAYHEALGKKDGHADANYQLGNIFLTQKNASMYIDYFNKAIEADKEFAPAYYALYQHYLYTEPTKAMEYFNEYNSRADKDVRNKYSYTDLLYLTKKYNDAISLAKELINSEGSDVQARLYKLIAYSYQDLSDTLSAIDYMNQYFQNEVDSNIIERDYQTMAELYLSGNKKDSAIAYYQKALSTTTDSADTYQYYKTLAKVSKSMADHKAEAHWLGKFYMGNDYVSNIDLFNWGIASYKAEDYLQADSVFGKYAVKYPEQGHGYYWRARSNAAIDTAMTEGLAIPHYQKLVEVLKDEPSDAEKKWLVQAYGYLAAYETNTEKDYDEAISYFEELLKMDPENKDAKTYIGMLEKRLESSNESPATNTNSTN